MSLLDEGTWSTEGPPARGEKRRRASKWDPVVAALKVQPGKWLRFKGQSRSQPGHMRDRYPGLIAEGHHGYIDHNGTRRVEMWLSWPAPATDESEAS